MQKGFTLIETMVVVSIIGMLSSTVLAALNQSRVGGRDVARIEQARQLDLGVQLYMADKGHPPDLQGTCGSNMNLDGQSVSSCIAVSTSGAGTEGNTAWSRLKMDLSPYISNIPNDPCGNSGCSTDGGQSTGYTYYSPAAVRYYCSDDCEDEDGYEIDVVTEKSGGGSGGGPSYPLIAGSETPSGAQRGDEASVVGFNFYPWPLVVNLDPVGGGGGMTINPVYSGKHVYFEFQVPINAEPGLYYLSVTTDDGIESNSVQFTIF